ncbi:signal peptidase II [Zongyangia hominis]|uniref:Lipoprotein signal peptidase n=1 Tax=Zongyangia hominis TaxID=2763677 RepID=A0A926E965_9FIRM|nr:signal peptidase II [Zongyangia hominis]MBC8569632.1 signal peptidase II [Zongyangia hominis]
MVTIALLSAVGLVAIDQLIKWWAVMALQGAGTVTMIPGVMELVYVQNNGAAWGLFAGKTWLLVGVTGLAIVAAIVALLMKKVKSTFLIWSISVVIAGGLGNLIDRIFRVDAVGRHFVVDYLNFSFIEFPVFNFADCCVVLGMIAIVVYILFFDGKKKSKPEAAA